MRMARSNAPWLLIAVAIVRRTNRRTLRNHFFRCLGAGPVWWSVEEFVEPLFSWAVGVVLEAMRARALLRMSDEDSLSSVTGGGGRGEELISPMRSRVSVNCALVGMPLRSVLCFVSTGSSLGTLDILLQVEVFPPIRNLAIKIFNAVIDDWTPEEAQAKCKSSSLDDEIARHNER